MESTAATNSRDVTGHQNVKELLYTARKCLLCKKRCLLHTRKVIYGFWKFLMKTLYFDDSVQVRDAQ